MTPTLMLYDFNHMNVLGIDYGHKKIGLAIAKDGFPEPFLVLQLPNKVEDHFLYFSQKIKEICQKEGIERIVLGFSSSSSDFIEEVKNFSELLKKEAGLEVELFEESMTSKEAQELMIRIGYNRKKRKTREDAVAACLILQDYIRSNVDASRYQDKTICNG